MVFQRDILFPWATIRANIAFALQAKGTPKRDMEPIIDELLTVVGLPLEVKRQRPAALSGGMRQRAGIARMLAGEPEVMLMDEPFAALDAQTRLRMQDLVTGLWSRLGRTVVFVTHDVDEAIRLSQTIFVLRDGRLAATIENPLPPARPAGQLADAAGAEHLGFKFGGDAKGGGQLERCWGRAGDRTPWLPGFRRAGAGSGYGDESARAPRTLPAAQAFF
jgi:NitT/TauT family transport system ATP-binding protein